MTRKYATVLERLNPRLWQRQLLTLNDIITVTGWSRSTLFRRMQEDFPRPVAATSRRGGLYVYVEVLRWANRHNTKREMTPQQFADHEACQRVEEAYLDSLPNDASRALYRRARLEESIRASYSEKFRKARKLRLSRD